MSKKIKCGKITFSTTREYEHDWITIKFDDENVVTILVEEFSEFVDWFNKERNNGLN